MDGIGKFWLLRRRTGRADGLAPAASSPLSVSWREKLAAIPHRDADPRCCRRYIRGCRRQ